MDVSLESKSLPSVGYSRKSYLQVTSQRLARGKLVHLNGWRSLALPSVGPGDLRRFKLNKKIKTINGSHFLFMKKLKQQNFQFLYVETYPAFFIPRDKEPSHSSSEKTSSEFDLLEIKITRKKEYIGKAEQVLYRYSSYYHRLYI